MVLLAVDFFKKGVHNEYELFKKFGLFEALNSQFRSNPRKSTPLDARAQSMRTLQTFDSARCCVLTQIVSVEVFTRSYEPAVPAGMAVEMTPQKLKESENVDFKLIFGL